MASVKVTMLSGEVVFAKDVADTAKIFDLMISLEPREGNDFVFFLPGHQIALMYCIYMVVLRECVTLISLSISAHYTVFKRRTRARVARVHY